MSLKFGESQPYGVIVCGAGHAGCEAALAAARMGVETLLLTGNLDTIAQMSCNPAIGGQAKGHIVREIDALGGEMGVNTDTTAIQFRLLNRSKGPAVQAPRAQCDKKAYQFRMKHTLELQPNLTIFQGMVDKLIFKNGKVVGVKTNLEVDFYAKAVVVTTGTFLRALMHVGQNKNEGGRMGDFSAKGLSGSFLEAGIELERLKTGTPPRILAKSIDFSALEIQEGDEEPVLFGFYDTRGEDELFHVEQFGERKLGWKPGEEQMACWMTYTTEKTEQLIKDNLHLSPMYSGEIKSKGPRYCPCIEDKIVRFADKDRHRLFLEPEGRNTNEWYINGLSTSLPFEIQAEMLRTVTGLENVVMIRPAYAVEYDFAPPTQLYPTLMSKKVEGLFFAGQINGTSGYEEAGGQGIIAGINAALYVEEQEPVVIGRNEGYIGVLIDDLVTKGTQEPYRMFSSRAEHRLLFNHGSAELRMWDHLQRLPQLVGEKRIRAIAQKREKIDYWVDYLEKEKTKGGRFADLMRRQENVDYPTEFISQTIAIQEEVKYRILYRGYLEREEKQIAKWKKLENMKLPPELNYDAIGGLRAESRDKLKLIRPQTLGQAQRISGVNPSDIGIIHVYLDTKFRQG